MKNLPKPTKTELAILNIMWLISPATVRQIHEEIIKNGKTSYTTTLKMLQVMHQKGLVSRDSEQKAHIYQPSLTKKETQKQMLEDLKNRLFGGSISSLVLQALGTNETTKQSEIDEIKALLEKVEEDNL
jgi:predicted transcriptional regulator